MPGRNAGANHKPPYSNEKIWPISTLVSLAQNLELERPKTPSIKMRLTLIDNELRRRAGIPKERG